MRHTQIYGNNWKLKNSCIFTAIIILKMFTTIKKAVLFVFFLTLASCIKQEDITTFVPEDTRVDITVLPAFIPQEGDAYIINSQGYNANGIVLFNYGNGSFRAYDLTCPTECLGAMSIDNSGIMTCTTCDNNEISFTQYQITTKEDGTTYGLREYYAKLEGGVVRITNF